MLSAPRRARRSLGTLIAAVLAAAVAVAGVGLADDARSVAGVDFGRLAGADRYATAAAVALDTFDSSTFALLVSGENFADAVASSYLAGVSDAPILLSRRDQVPAATIGVLQSLSVDFVVVVGGPDALSAAVPAQLTAAGFANARVAGANRYDTARAVSFVTGAPTVGHNESGVPTAILASGLTFPDALAAGPVAYDEGFPLLLTEPGSLHPAAEQALVTLGIRHVLVTGGPNAIGPAVEQRLGALGITSERLAGADRFATARAIAEKAIGVLGHTAAHVDIATGLDFPDALTGGPHAGAQHGVILLAPGAGTGANTAACSFLTDQAATVASGHLLGGEVAVATSVETSLEACAAGAGPGPDPGANTDFPASPAAAQLVTIGGAGASATWTFTGIDAVVDIALVPCYAVHPGPPTSFADDPIALDGAFPPDTHDSAVRRSDHLGRTYRVARIAPTTGAAQIVSANGAVTPTAYIDGFPLPAGGSLSVTVTATAADCAVPVVFADPSDDDEIDLDVLDRPTDDFGVGGALVATLGEAPEDRTIAGEVLFADEVGDSIVLTDGFRYDYGDAGDTYFYDEFSLPGPAQFELALSALDVVGIPGLPQAYNRVEVNRFDLVRDYSANPFDVDAAVGDFDGVPADTAANDVEVTFVAPVLPDGVIVDYAVDVYRCAPTCTLVRQALDSDHEPASAIPPVNQDANNDNIDDDVDAEVIVEDLQAGPHRFVVHAVTFTGQRSVFGSGPSDPVVSAAPPGSPRSTSATYAEGSQVNGKVDPGDTLFATFDETMAPPQVGDAVTVRDPSGRTATLVHGSNATFAVTGNALSIVVNAVVAEGLLALVGLQATDSAGVTDPGGLEWDLPGSPDRTFG